MYSIKSTMVVILFLINNTIYSQSEFPAFGNFSADEIKMKECSFDPEADAVILYDHAVSNYDRDYKLITERRIRIKILNQKGIERADIAIPFYSKDDYETLSDFQAYTFNFDDAGRSNYLQVEKKSYFTERTNTHWSRLKFAMPAVKAGSIIEYHYISTMKNYGGLDEWRFQTDMPTVKSCYLLYVLPNGEFTYSVQKNSRYPVVIRPMPGEGKIYFEMNNVAALRLEPFMDAPRDYLQKVIFQFSGYYSSGSRQNVNSTWRELAYDLATDKSYGSQLDKDLKADAIKILVAQQATPTGKIRSIYEFVKKNIAWDGMDSKYASDGVKAVWDRKKGSSGELNLLMINLLRSAGIEAYPILAAERDYGKIDSTFPFLEKFNKTVALAIADGKQYVLDATQENCPIGLTPYPLLGTTGFLVDKKIFNLIRIAPGNKFYKNIITINGEVNTNGLLTAETKVQSYDYARQLALDKIKTDRRKFIATNFETPYERLSVDSFLIPNNESDSLPLDQFVKFKQQLNQGGGFTIFNPNLFTGLEKNPFISSIRFTNVNFGYPYDVFVEGKFKVPAGAKVELPEDKSLISSDKAIQAFKQVRFENGELRVTMHFTQTTTLVKAENYPAIKDFYKKMVEMLNEPVVIKMEN